MLFRAEDEMAQDLLLKGEVFDVLTLFDEPVANEGEGLLRQGGEDVIGFPGL